VTVYRGNGRNRARTSVSDVQRSREGRDERKASGCARQRHPYRLERPQRNQRAVGPPPPERGHEKATARSDQGGEPGTRPALAGDPGDHGRVSHQAEERRAPEIALARKPRTAPLGWIPFTNQDVQIVGSIALFRGRKIRLWKHREIQGRFVSGNFSQDARGRWYCNIVCAVGRLTTNPTQVVGIDLGPKTAAQCSDGPDLPQARFYRDLEETLAEAQRRGRKRQVQTIHAKIANRRKDALHKFSRAVVNRSGAVFVGNISSPWQIASGAGKATLDVSWSMLRNLLDYKCDHAGVAFAEVDEADPTQTCSECLALSGPQGREGLAVRQWVCSAMGVRRLWRGS
jgi:IS605 OrfB family transposase